MRQGKVLVMMMYGSGGHHSMFDDLGAIGHGFGVK
jgi:hypothetical protein